MSATEHPAAMRFTLRSSQDQAAGRAGTPQRLTVAGTDALLARGRTASRSEEYEHHSQHGTAPGLGQGRGAGRGTPASHVMAKWPSASAATFAGSLAPPEASPDTGGEEDRDARGTDTPDMHEQEDVSIPGPLPHRSGNDDIPCSQLPFHNLSDEGKNAPFGCSQIL